MNRTIRLARWLSSSIVRRYAPSLAIAAAGLALFVAFVPVVANVAGEAATSNEGLGAPVLRCFEPLFSVGRRLSEAPSSPFR